MAADRGNSEQDRAGQSFARAVGAVEERTVLVADPSADDRAVLRHRLHNAAPGWRMLEVGTGAEALALCTDEEPDCLLFDYHLPDMEGTELLAQLRNVDDFGELGVAAIVLTDREEQDIVRASFAAGALDYLVKGTLTGHGLIRAVENAVERLDIQRKIHDQRRMLDQRNRELEDAKEALQAKVVQLADATRAKDQFLAVMSHEMRTPLNAILGYTDLMELEIDGPLTGGQRKQIDRIRVGSRHLLDLINDVLDIARADAKRLRVDMRRVEILPVLEEVAALLEREANAKGIRLDLESCSPGLPPVRADLQRLRQVLMNLVGNAIKFTEEGRVTVACEEGDDDDVRIVVQDTGIGIPRNVLPYVFTAFYQVESDLTRERGGSGLGLAISERLTRLMGGRLGVESRVGEGSTFTVVLPVAGPDDRPAQPLDEAPAAEGVMAPGPPDSSVAPAVTVVAFGDRPEILDALARRVRPVVSLTWTTDPAEVAPLALRERAGLVLLDISSDEGAAWRAAQAVQESGDLSGTAILLLPTIASVDVELSDPGGAAFDLGWVSLVPKPFTQEQLAGAVSSAAQRHGDDASPACDILILDDDPDSRRVAAAFLTEAMPEVRIREAVDGESGLAEMRSEVPDVVVLDLMMPVLDGFGVIAAMRADPLLEDVPVVVLSAKTLTDAERKFLGRTAIRVLQKGEHRLADVADLVLRAASGARGTGQLVAPEGG